MDAVTEFLLEPTPQAWSEHAVAQLDTLLLDHAGLELKAASQAQRLIRKYGSSDNRAVCDASVRMRLLHRMSRLAREELRHYEQVLAIIERRGIRYVPLAASGYAAALHAHIRSDEPQRLVDTLIVGALIEARSCERFSVIVPRLEPIEPELARFYRSLLRSEARHFADYLDLAKLIGGEGTLERIDELRALEAPLMFRASRQLRFHSGVPACG